MTSIIERQTGVWPGLENPPAVRVRARIARVLFERAVGALPLEVVYGDAVVPGRHPGLRIHRPEAFFNRVGAQGLIGFGESYMAGDWDADDLAGALTVLATQLATLIPPPLQRLRRLAVRRAPAADRGTIAGARRNVRRHYDLSNELFAEFLDESMAYSAALFPDPRAATWAGLRPAQEQKIDRLLDQAVYLTQGAVMLFVSAPVMVAMSEQGGLGPLAWAGAAVWLVGFTFEAVGDWQLGRFRADPASKGKVLDTGLWRYTRHPNYFGDAAVWWGLFLIAAEHWPGVLTVLSPVVMTYFLLAKTGKPLMERHLVSSRPGYADYVRRTSGFFPLPPKR